MVGTFYGMFTELGKFSQGQYQVEARIDGICQVKIHVLNEISIRVYVKFGSLVCGCFY